MHGFVHLHVHSHYSLLDGACRIGDLVGAARALGMEAIGLTDHGNLFGAIDFYRAARAGGVKPILGIEAYISPTTRHDRSMGNIQTASYHVILLAMNEAGWRNLIKLSSRSYLEGFYYRPRIDRQLLAECSEGLICSTACLGGEVPAALLAGRERDARRIAGEYLDIFGRDRLFIEVMNNGLADQDRVNPILIGLADQLGLGVVGTNDVHFLRREDKPAHEVLTCISTGKTLAEGGAIDYPPELYLKGPDEMRRALEHLPGAAETTLRIAEMCNLELDFSAKHLPVFQPPNGSTPDEYLRGLAEAGLAARFDGRAVPDEYAKRLDRELRVIAEKGYSSYFLIVNDFVSHAHGRGIPASPRGSGVATLLGYALGIAETDPLRYGLLFERFTDPQRTEAPDMDIDICQDGRPEIIRYVRRKYGHVAQIITYGTLKARAAVRDVGRVLDVPLGQVDQIAKLVPDQLNMTLAKALAEEPRLARMCQADQRVGLVLEYAQRLEGLARHAGVHAAGVIVAQVPLEQLVPLYKQTDSEEAITQWPGPTCGMIGLMKIDFLGLRTLTILQRARRLVRAATGRDIDPEQLPLDEAEVFELFQQARTDGVFQFESEGMKGVLTQMHPERIEELIAANAMYRPGPMELITAYCARKKGTEPVPSVHPLVDDILAETYGVMVYQEQVMQVLNRLGRLPLNRALTLIKAISKKKQDTIAAERPNFIDGARANGIDAGEAERLFELILRFAGYGFNKAHSTRYAILAYQTAYFKVHHPREFIAATLTLECGDTDKVVQYMASAKRLGVQIGPPDINTCDSDFAVDGDQVRFGLAAVKGVGAKAAAGVSEARRQVSRFENLYHFCEHVDLRTVNRATIEALVKCGAFDALGANRAAMMAALDAAIDLGQAAAAHRRSGQMSFFDMLDEPHAKPKPQFPNVEPWSQAQLLAAEKETLGFYVTSHPLAQYGRELASLTVPPGFALGRIADHLERPVTVGCMIAGVRPLTTRRDEPMAALAIEDLTGRCEAVVFPQAYARVGEVLTPESMVFITGKAGLRNGRPQIEVDGVIPIDRAIAERTGALLVRLPPAADHKRLLADIGRILARHPGPCPVYVEMRPSNRSDVLVTLRTGRQCCIAPCRQLVDELVEALGGQEHLVLRPKRPAAQAARRRQWQARNARTPAGSNGARSQIASPPVARFD